MVLSAAQQASLAHVTSYARARRAEALGTLGFIRKMCDIADAAYDDAIAQIRTRARVAVHFHPDRPCEDGRTVAARLLEDGRYRSQFETGVSSGSLSAHAGGSRDRWEDRLFGGAYQREATSFAERPKYGSLDLLRHADGPSPRFGSCYFVLAPAVSQRCTYTYLDSHEERVEKATFEELDDVLAALFTEAFLRDSALGEHDLRPPGLVERLRRRLALPLDAVDSLAMAHNLDHYIEAQIHGDISLADDADALVADPSYAGTEIGDCLAALCRRHAVMLRWHAGSALPASEVPRDFRGPTMPSLAARIARNGVVDAHAIGAAAAALHADPAAWADRGSAADVVQELKLLWHVIVKYGRPGRVSRDGAPAAG
jgi:hypothetical protein